MRAAESLGFPRAICDRFSSTPSRCLRGRWGSCDDVEYVFIQVMMWIGAVFEAVFCKDGKGNNRKRKRAAVGDDDNYQEEQSKWNSNAVYATNNPYWQALVYMSVAAKGPLRHFFAWAEQAVKTMNNFIKKAKLKGATYLGPTMLSRMVCEQCFVVMDEISALLEDSAIHDDAKWGLIWEVLYHTP